MSIDEEDMTLAAVVHEKVTYSQVKHWVLGQTEQFPYSLAGLCRNLFSCVVDNYCKAVVGLDDPEAIYDRGVIYLRYREQGSITKQCVIIHDDELANFMSRFDTQGDKNDPVTFRHCATLFE